MALGCFFLGFSTDTGLFPRLREWVSGHPGGVRLERPLRGDLLQGAPELDAALPGDVAVAELRAAGTTEGKWIAGHGNTDVHADHAARSPFADVARDGAARRED